MSNYLLKFEEISFTLIFSFKVNLFAPAWCIFINYVENILLFFFFFFMILFIVDIVGKNKKKIHFLYIEIRITVA